MLVRFSNQFSVRIRADVSDHPICLVCLKRVDWFGRKIEFDLLQGIKAETQVKSSPSYRRIFVVFCHGETGMVNMDYPEWDPIKDPRPEQDSPVQGV